GCWRVAAQSRPGSCRTRLVGYTVDRCILERKADQELGHNYTQQPAIELECDIKERIPARDLSQSEKTQGEGWIHVRSGALAPGRVDDRDGRQSHGDAGDKAADQGIFERLV